jgi:hypothetical protein
MAETVERPLGDDERTKIMRCLLMCCFNENQWERLAEPERAAIMAEYAAWVEGTVKNGQHLATGKLQPTAVAKTVRVSDGKASVTDGPFAETKEQLGGYHLLECTSLDEAVAIAQRIPTLRAGGTVEVRPLEPDDPAPGS